MPLLRVLAAALAAIVLVAGPVLGPARASGPLQPGEPAGGAAVSMNLVDVTPIALGVGGTLTATVEVTNDSSAPITDPRLELRTRSPRVTDRATVRSWAVDTTPDQHGPAVQTSPQRGALAPGQKATFTVSAPADQLGFSPEPYYWGTRRISLTLVNGTAPVTGLRTFVVWRPAGATDAITQSVLLNVGAPDPVQASRDPKAYAASAKNGQLAHIRDAALAPSADWVLDPALMDPPRLPTSGTGEETAQPTPAPKDGKNDKERTPVLAYEPDPTARGLADALDKGTGERTVLPAPYAQADPTSLDGDAAKGLASAGERVWHARKLAPRGLTLSIPGPQVSGDALEAAVDAGAGVLIVPSSSLREDPQGTVTPSSIAAFESSHGSVPVLAPDPELSAAFAQLSTASDPVLARQRLLAETATIASEHVEGARHILIAPGPVVDPDAQAVTSTLTAFAQAPWLREGRTADLLEAAQRGAWTTNTSTADQGLYAIGKVDRADVVPSGPDRTGAFTHLDRAAAPSRLDPALAQDISSAWAQTDLLSEVMSDDAALDAPRMQLLAAASARGISDPKGTASRIAKVRSGLDDMRKRVTIVPASGYNLISDSAGVPITITNGLDTPVSVTPVLSADRPLVRTQPLDQVTVPARGQTSITVPVEAIANGTVTLSAELRSADGKRLNPPVEVPLTVNPAWENWTTMVLVILMTVLVVVGVLRARRIGSDTRAPAVRVPEDPVELARSGRSQPSVPPAEKPAPVDHSDPPKEAP